jgi:hypothetical protein
VQCSSQVFECRAFPTAAAKSQSQKLTLLPPIPQTLFLLQSRSAPKSVSVYGSPNHHHLSTRTDNRHLTAKRRLRDCEDQEMLAMRQIKILTVDDHPLLCQGIAAVIQGEKEMLIVGGGCQWSGGY